MPQSLFRISRDPSGEQCLYADSEKGRAWLRRQKIEFVLMDYKGVRSPEQLRMWWGIVSRAYDNLPEALQAHYSDLHTFADAIKCELGHCRVVEHKGFTMKIPKSIALGNMEHPEFNAFFDATADLLARTLGVTVAELMEQGVEVVI